MIAGLGNPGSKYARTRHNVGFRAISLLAKRWEVPVPRRQALSLVARGNYEGQDVILAQPLTFMNRSGRALHQLATKHSLEEKDILVIHDDLDLEPGEIRIRPGGGDGGHRGMRSVQNYFCGKRLPRLRIGIGRPPVRDAVRDYVLSGFSPAEEKKIAEKSLPRVAEAVELIISSGLEEAMNKFN